MTKLLATAILILLFKFIAPSRAEVSLSRYNRYARPSTRLQRLELGITPYPAAGFRPRQKFNLPREQPIFPLATEQFSQNNQNIFNEDDSRVFPVTQPELVYGAPVNDFEQSEGRQRSLAVQDTFNNRPDLKYGAPPLENFEPFDNNFPRLRSSQENLESRSRYQKLRQNFESLQRFENFRNMPNNQDSDFELYTKAQKLRSQPKSERLINNREDREDDDDDVDDDEMPTDIEVDSKKSVATKKPTNIAPVQPPMVTYYPASAVGFVQPLTSYSFRLTSSLNPTAPYYQPQPIVYSASGRPLQTW